ncbi:cytochrome P450 [Aspergillus spinulosporus]
MLLFPPLLLPVNVPFQSGRGSWFLFHLAKCIYNLFFHPLSHIPGPWLAAATYLPRILPRRGQGRRPSSQACLADMYIHSLRIWPIARINPHELHCSDHHFISEIYTSGTGKRDKPVHQVTGSEAAAHATFSTTDHDIHRMRRSALAKFFSRVQVLRLEPTVRGLAERLCDKMLRTEKGRPFHAGAAYSQFTADVISGYCLGENLGLIGQEGWEEQIVDEVATVLRLGCTLRFVPWWKHVLSVVLLGPKDSSDALIVGMPNRIRKAQGDIKIKDRDGDGAGTILATVFTSLLQSDLPLQEKSVERMTSEGISLFAAGTAAVSWALTVATYHPLTKPAIVQRITAEVADLANSSGGPEKVDWSALERLPYLGAVIQVSLRLSYGVASRTAHIATGEDLVYRSEWQHKEVHYIIPRGSAIGMSAVIAHHDEAVFPDSHLFLPERWLDEKNQRRKELDRALLAFSKGSRGCLGINLAYCELYLLLALLVVRVFPHMRLYETTEADVAYDHDFFSPFPVYESKGVRVVVD